MINPRTFEGNRSSWNRAALVLFAILAMGCVDLVAQRPPPGPPPLIKENATVKVSEHVYVIPDEHVRFVPNVGIIVGSRATLVVDTGLGHRNGQAILREVAKVSENTDLYLVATHFHPEHAGGSSAFPATAKFLVSHAQQRDLDELGMDFAARFATFSPLMGELLKDVQFRRADIVFEREHNLDLGGIRVRVLSLGPTHTRGDTVVFVEEDGVLFAGDVVMNRAFLAFNRESSASTWLSVLNQLEQLRPSTIVPSHGDMGDASLIDQQRTVLQALHRRVGELKAQGRSLEEATEILTPEFQAKYPDWTAPNRIGRAVQSIYAELP